MGKEQVDMKNETTQAISKEELEKLIPVYGKQKVESKILEKELNNLNAQIKNIMSILDLDCCEAGGYIAKYDIRESKSLNEDKLLDLLVSKPSTYKKCLELGIIKTKEYIDSDMLEKCIYQGLLSKKLILDMEQCETSKKTAYLTISKKGD